MAKIPNNLLGIHAFVKSMISVPQRLVSDFGFSVQNNFDAGWNDSRAATFSNCQFSIRIVFIASAFTVSHRLSRAIPSRQVCHIESNRYESSENWDSG
jgi:hypothetical protein